MIVDVPFKNTSEIEWRYTPYTTNIIQAIKKRIRITNTFFTALPAKINTLATIEKSSKL